jgi:hypothetical protein
MFRIYLATPTELKKYTQTVVSLIYYNSHVNQREI